MIEVVRNTKTKRRRSRRWKRQIEDVRECTKDEEDPEYVPAKINDEDVRQCSKTSYDI